MLLTGGQGSASGLGARKQHGEVLAAQKNLAAYFEALQIVFDGSRSTVTGPEVASSLEANFTPVYASDLEASLYGPHQDMGWPVLVAQKDLVLRKLMRAAMARQRPIFRGSGLQK